MGSLKKINNLFIKDIFHGYCLKRQSLSKLFLPGDTQSAPSAGCSQAVGNWGRVGVRAFRAAD